MQWAPPCALINAVLGVPGEEQPDFLLQQRPVTLGAWKSAQAGGDPWG